MQQKHADKNPVKLTLKKMKKKTTTLAFVTFSPPVIERAVRWSCCCWLWQSQSGSLYLQSVSSSFFHALIKREIRRTRSEREEGLQLALLIETKRRKISSVLFPVKREDCGIKNVSNGGHGEFNDITVWYIIHFQVFSLFLHWEQTFTFFAAFKFY